MPAAPKPAPITRSFLKIKNLRLVTPERANELGVPAECPVLCSPYVIGAVHCHVCNIDYKPLIYQVGQQTTAHHFCKQGGGIYVQDAQDVSNKWVYYKGLFQAVVLPRGPIRMGDDRGYQFHSITLKRIITPQCTYCTTPIDHGYLAQLLGASYHYYEPACEQCKVGNEWDWAFTLRDGALHFSRTNALQLPANAGVLRRSGVIR